LLSEVAIIEDEYRLVAESSIDEDVLQALVDKRTDSRTFNSRLLSIARSIAS
jgi:hypothetical protein